MTFGDLRTANGKKALNEHLATRSYVEGYQPSQADVAVFDSLSGAPESSFPHALRWYNHIKSYGNDKKQFPAQSSGTSYKSSSAPPPAADEDDDDEIDLFGSEDEEASAEADRVREERLKKYAEKKAKKPALVAKSSVLLDVKPWDDETDMKAMEEQVRSIVKDGLIWGASKLVAVGYGINKLQILTVIEDEKISVDLLTEEIEGFEDFVQSVDIAAFNKI